MLAAFAPWILVGHSLPPVSGHQSKPKFSDGQAQLVPEFSNSADWIRERLWVETEFDSDQNGKRDRVHVDVTRQKQTETEGLRVPVVYESSPYFAGTGDGRSILWNVRHELGAEPPARTTHPDITFEPNRKVISNGLINTWVPRGFAVVHSEAPGTGLSEGSPTVGGAPERLAPKAVIDWLNGRAKGFTTIDGTEELKASWCTGKVGMTGTSYDGTIPVAAATTGVKGLEAIIPVAPTRPTTTITDQMGWSDTPAVGLARISIHFMISSTAVTPLVERQAIDFTETGCLLSFRTAKLVTITPSGKSEIC